MDTNINSAKHVTLYKLFTKKIKNIFWLFRGKIQKLAEKKLEETTKDSPFTSSTKKKERKVKRL